MTGRNPKYEGNLGGYGLRPLFAEGRWRAEVQSARGLVLHTTEPHASKEAALQAGREWLKRTTLGGAA